MYLMVLPYTSIDTYEVGGGGADNNSKMGGAGNINKQVVVAAIVNYSKTIF